VPQQSSKFSGIFAEKEPPPVHGRTEGSVQPRPIGRPPGKRSNPNFKPRTILMKDDLHFEATEILRRKRSGSGQDLSDLMNTLLEEWLKKQKAPSA
jgi:hypothetical protein